MRLRKPSKHEALIRNRSEHSSDPLTLDLRRKALRISGRDSSFKAILAYKNWRIKSPRRIISEYKKASKNFNRRVTVYFIYWSHHVDLYRKANCAATAFYPYTPAQTTGDAHNANAFLSSLAELR